MNELGPFTFWPAFVIVVGAFIALGAGGVLFAHRWLTGRTREGHNDTLVPMYLTAAVIYAVLLAFTVIAVWEQYTATKDNVNEEATALTTMYRATEAMPRSERPELRRLIREYTEAVIGPEWKAQQLHGGNSPVARKAIVDLYATLADHPPTAATAPINAAFVTELSEVTNARNKRTLASRDTLPWILWVGLITGGIIVVVMSCFLYMASAPLHAALSAMVGGLIGVLLFSTLALDSPLQGKLSIKPRALH
jgi:Protein of unknown function (DUF4239)